MFHFLKKHKNYNLEWLGIDVHSHLLPGIDDGAQNVQQSVSYIRKLSELGFHSFVCTPHIFKEWYPNSRKTILPAIEKLRKALLENNLLVKTSAAAEYMIDSDFDEILHQQDVLCLPGQHVLIEMSYAVENTFIEKYLFDLNIKGYIPVLAHPERYKYYHHDFTAYKRLREKGCLFQTNILSFSGYYGKDVKKIALKLLKENKIDLLGTDLHHEKHLYAIDHFIKTGQAYEILGKTLFKNKEFLIVDNG